MKKFYYGWWNVIATGTIHLWMAGTVYFSFTAFFNPIVNYFGWTYAAVAMAATLRSLEHGIVSPLVGLITDRVGSKFLLMLGTVLSGFGFIFLSFIISLQSFSLIFLFLAISSSILFPVPGWTVVANWFTHKRGFAMAIQSVALGCGGILIFFVNYLISIFGWRITLIIIGICTWAICLPCSIVVRNKPHKYNASESTKEKPISENKGCAYNYILKKNTYSNYSLGMALKAHTFWVIVITGIISESALLAVTVHIMPYLLIMDINRHYASIIATFLILSSITGRLIVGLFSNRINTHYLLAFGLSLQAIGLFLFARTETIYHAILFLIFFGPGFGAVVTIRLIIQAEHFGSVAYGSIQGITLGMILFGSMLSPYTVGLVYDLYGNYYWSWLSFACALLASSFLAITIKQPEAKE